MKKNIDTYLYGNVYPRWVVVLIDSFIIALSFLLAYYVRFDSEITTLFMSKLLWILSINIFCFYLFKIPSRVLRYSSFSDFIRIFIAQTFSYILLFIIDMLVLGLTGAYWIPSGVLPMTYVLGTGMLICLRIVVKAGFEFRSFNKRDTIRVMVYAEEDKGADIVRRLRGDNKSRYRIRGFISDDFKMNGRYLMAIPIYMNNDKLVTVINERMVDAIVVDSVKMKIIKKSELTDKLLSRGIKLITLSPMEELKGGKEQKNLSSTRNIMIEDLLMREPMKINLENISSLFRGKRVMITGAAGSIGRELVKQIASAHPEMFILIDQAETPMHDVRLMLDDEFGEIEAHTIVADITNKSRIENIFILYKPQYVFHIAAYKHIPMLEMDVSEAIQVNVLGTCNMADLSVEYKVEKFILASTDKAANPVSVMGASKRIAEIYVQSLARMLELKEERLMKFIIVRFGNILDSNGSVLYRFKEQIANKETLIVTHPDAARYFMTVTEVVCLILETCFMKRKDIIYALDMGNPVKILDLAKRMINLSGYIAGKDIKIEFAGFRAGEKISDESLDKGMCTFTEHNKVMAVPVDEYDYDSVNSKIRKMIVDSYGGDVSQMISDMKTLIPEFVSNECGCEKFIKNNE